MNLSIVILIKNEERHLPRLLENIALLKANILVVDSESSDRSIEICREFGVEVIVLPWLGNQAKQFNWILDNYKFKTDWILRLDADEYLLHETQKELLDFFKSPNIHKYDAVSMNRRHIFQGAWLKHGTYPTPIIRLFRFGKARYPQDSIMDEHLEVEEKKVYYFQGDFVDHSLLSLEEWKRKHVEYAMREANMISIGQIHPKKVKYYQLPRYLRPWILFFYNFIIKQGFRNGKAGFIWHLNRDIIYRTLIDYLINEKQK